MGIGYLDGDDDIVALATVPGEGAISVVRTAGPGCIDRLAGAFSRPDVLKGASGYSAVYGKLLDSDGTAVDETVAVVFRAPKSYTGQDGVDVMCHGGRATAERALGALVSAGFRLALPGEFTFRAFASGKMDLARAEAVDELVRARTFAAQADALARLSGGLSRELEGLRRELVRIAAACALRLDYGEDEHPEDISDELPAIRSLLAACRALAATYTVGRLLKDGARVALAGRTNAGKSSLFNRLLKEERAIVSNAHGTTRDYLEADLDLGGVPVRLLDTAGLRDSTDPIEVEGVRRSTLVAGGADAVVYVVDAIDGLSETDRSFVAARPDAVLAWNKVDEPSAHAAPPGWISVSARTGLGEADLAAAIGARLSGSAGASGGFAASRTRIASARQRDALLRAAECLADAESAIANDSPVDLIALDVSAALMAIGEITGETTGEDILDSLFGHFCVGK
ncbi:MAG: tRNA uridine-5-carboxymethylaminomethyl(34) synthesis GTPase MnmE [Spirochaetales bacterium]|nr:MAG: tRNA uridine-5-carboxymethylaminomethyl(34) synthesis GTPase MnmE [Spirochaetales bacterium]